MDVRGRHSFKLGFTWDYLDSFQASPEANIGFGRRPASDLRDLNATGYGVASFLLGLLPTRAAPPETHPLCSVITNTSSSCRIRFASTHG